MTGPEALRRVFDVTDTMVNDSHARKEFYWATICRLAETHPDALAEAVAHVWQEG